MRQVTSKQIPAWYTLITDLYRFDHLLMAQVKQVTIWHVLFFNDWVISWGVICGVKVKLIFWYPCSEPSLLSEIVKIYLSNSSCLGQVIYLNRE